MSVCCCSLAGTKACKTCTNNYDYGNFDKESIPNPLRVVEKEELTLYQTIIKIADRNGINYKLNSSDNHKIIDDEGNEIELTEDYFGIDLAKEE